jgi:hypothetical protein
MSTEEEDWIREERSRKLSARDGGGNDDGDDDDSAVAQLRAFKAINAVAKQWEGAVRRSNLEERYGVVPASKAPPRPPGKLWRHQLDVRCRDRIVRPRHAVPPLCLSIAMACARLWQVRRIYKSRTCQHFVALLILANLVVNIVEKQIGARHADANHGGER